MIWRLAFVAILAVSLGGCATARLVTYCVAHPQNCN